MIKKDEFFLEGRLSPNNGFEQPANRLTVASQHMISPAQAGDQSIIDYPWKHVCSDWKTRASLRA